MLSNDVVDFSREEGVHGAKLFGFGPLQELSRIEFRVFPSSVLQIVNPRGCREWGHWRAKILVAQAVGLGCVTKTLRFCSRKLKLLFKLCHRLFSVPSPVRKFLLILKNLTSFGIILGLKLVHPTVIVRLAKL